MNADCRLEELIYNYIVFNNQSRECWCRVSFYVIRFWRLFAYIYLYWNVLVVWQFNL